MRGVDQPVASSRGGAPEFLAGALVEGGNEVAIAFAVPVNDDGVAGKGGGRAFAEAHAGFHLAEVRFPFEGAVEVVAVEAARAEEGEDDAAVGDGGGGGEGVVVLAAFVGDFLAGDFLPEDFAGGAIKAEDGELQGFAGFGRGDLAGGRDGGEEKDAVAPDDGRGIAFAGDGGFPLDVVGLAPGERGIGERGGAGAERAAPLGPESVRRIGPGWGGGSQT